MTPASVGPDAPGLVPDSAARVLADCLLTGSDPFTTNEDVAEAAGEAMAEALRKAGFDV